MNTFLNIGFISYLKELEKCYIFSFSVPAKNKNASTFYCNAVVFKNEWTPKLEDGQKVFIKGSLAMESYQDKNHQERTQLKLYAESCEAVGYSNKKEERQYCIKSENKQKNKKPITRDASDDEIPF